MTHTDKKNKSPAVFLDRDGVLNASIVRDGKPYPPHTISELFIFPEIDEYLQTLKTAGFYLICVTNQPDVARGAARKADVEAMNQVLMDSLPLDAIRVCYHDDGDQCDCRKPLPGLLTAAADDFGIHLEKSFMIGDRWRDIEAGQRAGCQTVWIQNGYREKAPDHPADFVTDTTVTALQWVLNQVSHS